MERERKNRSDERNNPSRAMQCRTSFWLSPSEVTQKPNGTSSCHRNSDRNSLVEEVKRAREMKIKTVRRERSGKVGQKRER